VEGGNVLLTVTVQGREGEGEEDQVPRGGGRQVLFMVRERKRYYFRGRVHKKRTGRRFANSIITLVFFDDNHQNNNNREHI
jgi:hypothetical protein